MSGNNCGVEGGSNFAFEHGMWALLLAKPFKNMPNSLEFLSTEVFSKRRKAYAC